MCVTRDAAKPDTQKMDSLPSALTCGHKAAHKVKSYRLNVERRKIKTSEGLTMRTTAFIRSTAIRAAAIAALAVAPTVLAGDPPPQYAASCGACHAVGVAGAPATGNAEAWAPRMAKGMEALVASVRNGLNAMPPGGLCNSCSDEDYAALITYMAAAQ
jgi:cytochrome c5